MDSRHRAGLDWRIVLVIAVIALSFVAILKFPDVIPGTYIWAAALATAAFASPRTTLVIALLASATILLGYALTDNFHGPIMWLRIGGFAVLVAVGYVIARQRSQSEERLRTQATTDALTGLPNRRLLLERLQAQLEIRDADQSSAVIYADLDDFKMVNDTHGHSLGDEVLVHAGRRLQSCLDPADTLARFGGDEFVIAVPVTGGRGGVDELCRRIALAFERPLETHGVQVDTGITLGVAMSSGPRKWEARELLDAADRALRDGKLQGRGGSRVVVL